VGSTPSKGLTVDYLLGSERAKMMSSYLTPLLYFGTLITHDTPRGGGSLL
jgi:hypothetical protein